jgi:glycosyltransferase involved in cell wall biosynthesis
MNIGVVIIGRNEGERLVRCIRSVQAQGELPIVFVDSGSTDDSVARARALGVDVVGLSAERPFTAARGRNAGFQWLRAQHPDLEMVQFLDGDTELQPGWFAAAADLLRREPALAAVTGRRRERHPDATLFNLLCDIEWDTPVSDDAEAFGGDVLMRVSDMVLAGGYDETLIAGEDPDLSVRLRAQGRRIARVDAEMTLHDAAMTSVSQWWRRMARAGHAYAEGADRHRERGVWRKEVRSNWAWGVALPAFGVLASVPSLGASLLVASGGFATLAVKVRRDSLRRGMPAERANPYAIFTALAKIPLASGQAEYWWHRLRGKKRAIIEYK